MHDVEAHVAGARDAAHRVEVRAVVVHERACVVEDLRDLFDVLVEEPERRRVREHQRGGVLVDLRAQVVDVDVAARVGLHRRHLVARHRHGRRVRAVRRVGDHDLAPLLRLAAVVEVRAHEHQARELALRAGGRLQRDRVQARHLGEDLLQPPLELERALDAVLVLQRMQAREARQADEPLVDARVVLHRARAERIEAVVDAEVARRELGEVAHELELRHLGSRGGSARRSSSGTSRRGQPVVLRDRRRAPARLRLLVDQLHRATSASTSASRSISAGVRFSVTATSSTSSMPS